MNTAAHAPQASEDWLTTRIRELRAQDPQFRDSFALQEVGTAKRQPGLRLAQVVQTVMEGYADRPALGQRARELVGERGTLRLLPKFETITYR